MIDLEGFILAGGSSSRMGERKEQLAIGDRSFLERAVDVLTIATNGRVTIVGNIDQENGGPHYPRIVSDLEVESAAGLLRRASIIGLHTALFYSTTSWLAVLACDLPFVSSSLFVRLSEFCSDNNDAVVPIQPDGRLQPLSALYRRDRCLSAAREYISGDNWSLNGFLERLNVRRVQFDEIADLAGSERFFININTPGEYEKVRHMLKIERLTKF